MVSKPFDGGRNAVPSGCCSVVGIWAGADQVSDIAGSRLDGPVDVFVELGGEFTDAMIVQRKRAFDGAKFSGEFGYSGDIEFRACSCGTGSECVEPPD